jgi:hypothetical protein
LDEKALTNQLHTRQQLAATKIEILHGPAGCCKYKPERARYSEGKNGMLQKHVTAEQ